MNIQKTIRQKHSRLDGQNKNGYALMMALVCMIMVMQTIVLCSLYIRQSAWLIEADRQSALDMLIIEKAKEMAADNSYIRRCSLSENLQSWKSEIIEDVKVSFEDHETFIQITYSRNGMDFEARLYYSQQGVLAFEYVQ